MVLPSDPTDVWRGKHVNRVFDKAVAQTCSWGSILSNEQMTQAAEEALDFHASLCRIPSVGVEIPPELDVFVCAFGHHGSLYQGFSSDA